MNKYVRAGLGVAGAVTLVYGCNKAQDAPGLGGEMRSCEDIPGYLSGESTTPQELGELIVVAELAGSSGIDDPSSSLLGDKADKPGELACTASNPNTNAPQLKLTIAGVALKTAIEEGVLSYGEQPLELELIPPATGS